MGWSLSPGKFRIFLLHYTQTGSGAHPTSCSVVTTGSFLGVKHLGHEADHLTSSQCQGQDYAYQYIHSPIHLHGVVLN
jgi:hypothetical protein